MLVGGICCCCLPYNCHGLFPSKNFWGATWVVDVAFCFIISANTSASFQNLPSSFVYNVFFWEEDQGAAAVPISLEVRCNFYHNQRAFARSIKQWSILVRRQHLQYNPLKIFFITDGHFFEYNEKVLRWHHQKDRCIVGRISVHPQTYYT